MTTPRVRSADRPPYGVAAVAAGAIFAIYLLTIAPTTQFWDTSEYIAAARVLGIPHPPGNPLFVLLAHVWALLPLADAYALRLNLFAAVTSALASGFLFLVAERFLRETTEAPRGARLAAAFGGILVGATSFTVWNQSTVNEKVYTLSLLSIALVLWLAVHWGDDESGSHRDRWLILIAYLIALSSTNHMMGVLAVPAVAVYVLVTDPHVMSRPWALILAFTLAVAVSGAWSAVVDGPAAERAVLLLVAAALVAYTAWRDPGEFRRPGLYLALLAVAVGVSLNYLFLPIRAGHFPSINEGEPTSWAALQSVLGREQYAKPPLTERQASLWGQLVNYWQYLTWQYGHDWPERARRSLAVLFVALGLAGGWRQWQRDRRGAMAMTALVLTVTFALIFYLNFKYGFSVFPERELPREVRERDYFFVASFLVWGVWVALGLGWLMDGVAGFFRERLTVPVRWAAAGGVLAFALVPLAGNRLSASRAGETAPRDFAVDLLQSVEPYAILVTAGDNDTFPLWYAQEVEGVRQDVLIANQSLMNTEWHLRQLKRRPVFPFDSAAALPIYQGRSWPRPTQDALELSYQDLEMLPPGYQVTQPSEFRAGSVRALIPRGILERSDLAALQLIRDNLGERPIYFSRTTGNWADRLSLTPHLLGHGLARKLVPDSIRASDSTVAVPGLGWVDVPRTQYLLFDVYHAESIARARPRGWVDRPSEGILSLYWVMYVSWDEMVKALERDATARIRPDSTLLESAGSARDLADRIFRTTSMGQ